MVAGRTRSSRAISWFVRPVAAQRSTSVSRGVSLISRHAAASLFRDEVDYDGFADLARLTITSEDGNFGGVRTGNASYLDTTGWTGVYAPDVTFGGPVYVGNISASADASAVLVLKSATDVRVTGGDLRQENRSDVEVAGFDRLQFTAGTSSHGDVVPPQPNRGRLVRDGVDVTQTVAPTN